MKKLGWRVYLLRSCKYLKLIFLVKYLASIVFCYVKKNSRILCKYLKNVLTNIRIIYDEKRL